MAHEQEKYVCFSIFPSSLLTNLSPFFRDRERALNKTVTVSVLRGKALAAMDSVGIFGKGDGTSDPYVRATWMGEEIFKSKVVKKCLDPEWSQNGEGGQCFKVTVPRKIMEAQKLSAVQKRIYTLQIDVYDHDIVGVSKIEGKVHNIIINSASLFVLSLDLQSNPYLLGF